MLEENPQTIGQKIWRGLVGLFLGILVVMLIITLLPAGDMEESLINQLTGRVSTQAGSIGGKSIPMDYFNSARKNCYFRYKEYAPNLASDDGILADCAFQTLRSVFVGKEIADAFGYRVSELAIKRELSRQAREYHKEASMQAGFDTEDLRSADEIYRNLLQSEPLLFRIETATAMNLFNEFLYTDLKKSPGQILVEEEAKSARLGLRIVFFPTSVLNEIAERNIEVTDAEILAEYEKETKSGTTPKGEDGKPLSLEDRRSILSSKIRFDKRSKAVDAIRQNLQKMRQDGANLEDLAKFVSTKPVLFRELKIEDLNSINLSGNTLRPLQNGDFLRDMSEIGFGPRRIGGPYQDGDRNYFVEFLSLELPKLSSPKEPQEMESRNFLASVFLEMNQSVGKERPLIKNIRISSD